MTDDMAIHTCGSSYSYCNGNCADCTQPDTYATNSTDTRKYLVGIDLHRPTKDEYEESRAASRSLSSWIQLSRERQNTLLDDLCKERAIEKDYLKMYEAHHDLIRRYELYKELEANG